MKLGLMFKRKQNIIMELPKPQRIIVHNFFVFYPINIYCLDENEQLVEIKEPLKSFKLWRPKNKVKYVCELSI